MKLIIASALSAVLLLPVHAHGEDPDTIDDLSWITAFPDSSKDLRPQLESLDLSIKQEPDNAQLYLQRGAILLGLNRFERAVEDFSFAINKADIDEAYYGRGLARGRIQQHDAAISDLDIYIIRHPQSSIAFTKRGIRKLWNDDREAARADFLKAIQLDENNAEAHDDLGVIYAQEGKYDLAIRQFKNTIRIDPTFHKAYHNLAMVYYLTDQNLLALANVNQGIAIAPGARNTLLLKAEILTALGEAEYARQLTEEAQNMQSGDWSERAPVE